MTGMIPPLNFQLQAPSSIGAGLPFTSMQSSFAVAATQHQFSGQQTFIPGDSIHQGTDPNSPELFRQNLHLAQDHVARIQSLTRSALAGIQNAYRPGNHPSQTEADIGALKQAIQQLDTFMWQTGVGALPVLPVPGSTPSPITLPAESQMIDETNKAIQLLYEKLKRAQDSATVVANLLGAPSSK